MSIWSLRKQARRKAAQEERAHAARRPHPVLDALEFPEDVTGNSVRVILLGGRRMLIENHLGVAEVGREEIRLVTREGMISIRGEELSLQDVREGALAVVGRISAVELPPYGPGGGAGE